MSGDESYPLENLVRQPARAPRRFGMHVPLIFMTAFALLLGTLRGLGVSPMVLAIIAALLLGVTIGQVVLFRGKRPKSASALAGAILFPLLVLGLNADLDDLPPFVLPFVGPDLLAMALAGAMLGVLAGLLVAGGFRAIELLSGRSFHAPAEIELQPFTAADIDTLVGWLRSILIFGRWSCGRFAYPLERKHIEARLREGDVGGTSRLCFKAVYQHSQRMVGYVEFGHVDRAAKSATIELPIIDPGEPSRGELSVTLLRAAVAMASGPMRLVTLEANVPLMPDGGRGCYRTAGFLEEPTPPSAAPDDRGPKCVWRIEQQEG